VLPYFFSESLLIAVTANTKPKTRPALHFHMHTGTLSAYYRKKRQIYLNNMNMKLRYSCDIVFSSYLFAVLIASAIA
jgi:hypothetical protein